MISKSRVLLAEDSATNRKLIGSVLEAWGCMVTEATTGIEAVELSTGATSHSFDIILMDIEMPGLNGDDATRLIRSHEAEHLDRPPVPIIALTSNGHPEQVASYLAAGMNAYLAKPVDWPKLFAMIEALVLKNDRS